MAALRAGCCALVLSALLAPVLAPVPARAQDAAPVLVGTIAGLGGLTSNIATIVFAAQGRAYSRGWMTAAVLSSAGCLGTTIGLLPHADEPGAAIGVVGSLLLAAFPLIWAGRTAWSDDVPWGEVFDPAGRTPPPSASARDVFGERRALSADALVLPLPALRF